MWPNPQETVDLVTFTEEILNGKRHFLCNVNVVMEWYLGPCQTSMMDLFAKMVRSQKPLNIFTKRPITDVWLCSKYVSANYNSLKQNKGTTKTSFSTYSLKFSNLFSFNKLKTCINYAINLINCFLSNLPSGA